MTSLRTDQNTKDLAIVDGDFVLIEGIEEVDQLLRQTLKTFEGEWFLDSSVGIPYHDEMFKKNPDIANLDAIIKSAILETKGVLRLEKFEMSFLNGNRSLSIAFEVLSEDGIITINEVL